MDSRAARRRVALAAALTGSFMVVEIAGGLISGSLALLADAAHMLTDTGSLLLAWLGYRLSERPADANRSYGYGRVRILAAFTNGILLLVLSAWILWEALQRLIWPAQIMGHVMIMVAAGGLVINIAAFLILHGGDRNDLNLKGAVSHVLADLLGSLAAIAAALIILATGWTPADPLLSAIVAGLVCHAGIGILRRSGHILLEATPPGLSAALIIRDLKDHLPGLRDAGHVHAWAITESRTMITLEIMAQPEADPDRLRRDVKTRLAEKFSISHATVEVISCPD